MLDDEKRSDEHNATLGKTLCCFGSLPILMVRGDEFTRETWSILLPSSLLLSVPIPGTEKI